MSAATRGESTSLEKIDDAPHVAAGHYALKYFINVYIHQTNMRTNELSGKD
jgi:hypothetical protein